jgi:GNAT superfamily N-acetyltransferase
MRIEITPVKSRSHQKQFMQLAWMLYEEDPHWVPPLRIDLREMLNFRRHPFYDDAEIQCFLASRQGRLVGRIAAIIDRAHNRQHGENRGMFGFFESIDDQEVADSLFRSATDWMSSKGMTDARGPLNPAMNYTCGLLVEGFDSPPTFLMTYNKPYYERLITRFGFEKSQDMFAYWGHIDMLSGLDPKMLFVINECKRRFQVTVRPLNRKKFLEDVLSFMRIYNRALVGTWGFVPMTERELRHLASGMKHLIVPEMTTLAEIDGQVVGAVFGMLDYNPLIKKIDGRLFPFGFLRLLFGRRAIKKVRLVSTNVLPEYQRWGLGIVLMSRLVQDAIDWGIEEGEFSWVLESNKLSRGTLERGGAKLIKTYRIYDKHLS